MSFASKSAAYKDLVGVSAQGSACATSGDKRVVAGSSAKSLLYMKVAGTQTCGDRMPEGLRPHDLTATDLATVKSWIDSGALND
jgi:hypothetical protein